MFKKIEDINLLGLMKDIKNMMAEGIFELKNEDYEIKIKVTHSMTDLKPINKLLDIMVKEDYLVPEIYFENKSDFEKCFDLKYVDDLLDSFNSIRIEEIRVEHKDTYNGTLIYHEVYGGKMKFELACIKFLTGFQRNIILDLTD